MRLAGAHGEADGRQQADQLVASTLRKALRGNGWCRLVPANGPRGHGSETKAPLWDPAGLSQSAVQLTTSVTKSAEGEL